MALLCSSKQTEPLRAMKEKNKNNKWRTSGTCLCQNKTSVTPHLLTCSWGGAGSTWADSGSRLGPACRSAARCCPAPTRTGSDPEGQEKKNIIYQQELIWVVKRGSTTLQHAKPRGRKRLEPGYCSCRVLRGSIEVHKQSTCMGVFSPRVRSAAALLFSPSSCRSGSGTESREKSTVTRFAARLAGSTPSSWSRRRGGTLTECLLVNLSLRCVVVDQRGGARELWREEVRASESSNNVNEFFLNYF